MGRVYDGLLDGFDPMIEATYTCDSILQVNHKDIPGIVERYCQKRFRGAVLEECLQSKALDKLVDGLKVRCRYGMRKDFVFWRISRYISVGYFAQIRGEIAEFIF